MTIPVEIMLRGNDRVFTHSVVQPGDPGTWKAGDMASVLRSILVAIDRVQNPDKEDDVDVSLRGLSWIAHDTPEGVVIAIEIHSASAVAGPVKLSQKKLDDLIGAALRAERPADVVH